MVFADSRYNFSSKQDKLPEWIRKYISTDFTNLSSDVAVSITRRFVREMAQPWDPLSHVGTDLWSKEHIPNQPT